MKITYTSRFIIKVMMRNALTKEIRISPIIILSTTKKCYMYCSRFTVFSILKRDDLRAVIKVIYWLTV